MQEEEINSDVEEQEIPASKLKDSSQNQNNVSNHSSSQNLQGSLLKPTPLRTPGRLSRSIMRPHENRQRLMVDKIVLQDFKSYAGQKIIGPFHKSFTSVVGPNGSGKSNLIESLLFVFGKRANWMRLKQLHQLIHNSGQKNSPKKASVEVYFHEILDKENDEYEIIPNTNFTVRRTVHMSNQTTYEINRRGVKQEDVINLLKSKGIDLNNNRFLILQGEVEQISLMKPKSGDPDKPGLLEYLEDIIGSNQHKERIEELEESYEKDNETRREKGERMRITENDLEKLNESKNLAIDYIRREKLIYQIQNVLNQVFRYSANQKVIQTETKIEEQQQQLKDTKQQFKEKIQENKSLLQAWQKKRTELDETKSMRNKCKSEFTNLQEKDTKIRSEIKFETENQVKLEDKKEELERDYSKIVDDEKEMKKELPSKEKNLDKITEEKEEEEEKFSQMRAKVNQNNKKLVQEKKSVQNKLQPFENKIKTLKQQQNVIQDKVKMLQQDNGDIEGQMRQLNETIQKSQDEIMQNDQVIQQIQEAQKRMVEIKDMQYNELKTVDQEIDRLQKDSYGLQRQIDQSRANQNESQQRNQLVSELIRAQQNGEVSGIHGRLGDLGAIDGKFDIAITTACGALDNIVVSNQESGQQCIKLLREKRLGRAQFMPVKTLNDEWYQKSRQPFNAPPGSQRLFDLIKIKKEEYSALFYFALRDTLVCQDLDQGTKIAYGQQRFRVVTLDGKLIDTSGTMSGGGRPKKGGMGTQLKGEVSDVNVQELQNQRVMLEKQIQNLRQQQDQVKAKINETARDETHAKSVLNEKKNEIGFKQQQIEDYERKLKYYQQQIDKSHDNEQEVKALENQLKKLSDEENKKEQECMELKEELQRIEEKFTSLGGFEMKEQEQLVKQLQKNHQKLEHDVNQIRNKLQNTEKTLKKNEKDSKDVNSKLQKVVKKIETSKEQLNQLEEEAMQVLGKLKGLEEKLGEMEQEQQQQDEQKNQLDKMITQMKNELDKMGNELDNFRQQHKKYQHDYTQYDKKLETLRSEYTSIIDGYDFLNDIDEIAKFSTDPDQQEENQNNENKSNNEEMEIEQESNPLEETVQEIEKSNQKARKRMSIGIDQKQYLQKDVTEDFTNDELEQATKYAENFNYKLRNEESKLQNLKQDININTIMEFKDKYVDYKTKKTEFENVKKKLAEIRAEIDNKKKLRFEEFIQGFNTISQKLKETYQNLTQGGDAELELIDSLDPFADGINFTVRPPKKSWKQINKLSGGEKTLSSLSLIFALHYYKPTPLYFMDEIDAALDFKNVSVVGHYVKERTQDAQFIIISLRNNMFELANKLVGVYKTFDQTKTIAIVPEKVQQKLEQSKKDKENNDPNIE